MDVEIVGSAELRRIAAQIKAEGTKGLGREFGQALKDAGKPVERSVRKEYRTLPSSGGYEGLFAKSLRFRYNLRAGGRQASYRMTTFADGTSERRDIEALESGRLRHPVFGRSRRGKRKGEFIPNPWAVTSVKGGFHRRGTEGAADEAEREMSKVVDEFAARVIE